MAGARLHGKVLIDAKAAIVSTWGMTAKEVGREWLAYLNGKSSMFEDFCRFKPRSNAKRPPWNEWRITRLRVFERDNFTCTYCGTTDGPMECDHIKAVSRGGSHDDENLTTACKPCNRKKGAK